MPPIGKWTPGGRKGNRLDGPGGRSVVVPASDPTLATRLEARGGQGRGGLRDRDGNLAPDGKGRAAGSWLEG